MQKRNINTFNTFMREAARVGNELGENGYRFRRWLSIGKLHRLARYMRVMGWHIPARVIVQCKERGTL